MAWWVYKCNSSEKRYNAGRDWRVFFDERAAGGRAARWGLLSVIPALKQLHADDMVFAYQTNRNELVGLVRVAQIVEDEVCCVAVEEFGVRVRPLKAKSKALAAIPAFRPGPKQTLYRISEEDAQLLRGAARSAAAGAAGRPAGPATAASS
jgi:hypothetical protein